MMALASPPRDGHSLANFVGDEITNTPLTTEQQRLYCIAYEEARRRLIQKLDDVEQRREQQARNKFSLMPAEIRKMKMGDFMQLVKQSMETDSEEDGSTNEKCVGEQNTTQEDTASASSSQEDEESQSEDLGDVTVSTNQIPSTDLELPPELQLVAAKPPKAKKTKKGTKTKRVKISRNMKTPSTAQRQKCPKWLSTPIHSNTQSTRKLGPGEKPIAQVHVYSESGSPLPVDLKNMPRHVQEAIRESYKEVLEYLS